MNKIGISIITLTYNNFLQLQKTLSSIAHLSNIESIVINGGSCSQTLQFLNDPSCFSGRSISEPDDGIADAFNKGLKMAHGQFVMFLNSGDILIDPHYLNWAQQTLNNNHQITFVHSDIYFIDQWLGKSYFQFHVKNLGRGMPYFHQSMIVLRQIFTLTGGFSSDYRIGMDFDWVVRLHKGNHQGLHYPHATIEMDGQGVSVTKEAASLQECRFSLQSHSMYQLKEKWGWWQRWLLFQARSYLYFLGGEKLLKWAKAMKWKLTHYH